MSHSHNIFSNISPADYAEVSVLARFVGENMISRLELVTLQPSVILDIGCGTGYCTQLLKQHYPSAEILAVDSVEAMLRYQSSSQAIQCVSAEGERLPLKNHSVDLIFANLLLPWCKNWESVLHEWRRVLRPDGLLIFTCFGLDTLRELHQDDRQLLQLKDMHEVGDTLLHARFSDPVMDVEYLSLSYRDYEKLAYELQMSGMIETACMPTLESSTLKLTCEIIYGHTFGMPIANEFVADDEGVVKIPLAHLRRK
jgi:malonyl-CoA O-methyltransferase